MSKHIYFDTLFTSLEELQQSKQLDFHDPYSVAGAFINCLMHYEVDVDVTIEMINYLRGPRELSTFEKQFLRDRLAGKMYVVRSFFQGTTVQNNYAPSIPYDIEIFEMAHSKDQYNDGYLTLYVQSSGADHPRSIQLRHKASTDEWFIWEQMILSDIRIPSELDPWH